MRRINSRQIWVTKAEVSMTRRFDALLEQGYGIHEAVVALRGRRSQLSEEFWMHLAS